MNFIVGDKVLYIGEDDPILYIKTGIVYTIAYDDSFEFNVRLAEITQKHSYDTRFFILATPLIEALT
jgi:hypothetical protein